VRLAATADFPARLDWAAHRGQ